MKNSLQVFRSRFSKLKPYIVICFVLTFLILAAHEYYLKYFYILKDQNELKRIIMSYGNYSVLVYIILQILQVVAFFIPGEIIQIAGGYIFGVFLGSILSIIGITLGSAAAYGFSAYYGKPLVNKIISKKDLKFFNRILNCGNINSIVFLLYLIPGIPKDALAYISGVSSISFRNFIILSTIARIPGILGSAYFGANISGNNKLVIIIIAVVSIALFVLGVFRGESIVKGFVRKKCERGDE